MHPTHIKIYDAFRRLYRDRVYAHIQNSVRGSNLAMRILNKPLISRFDRGEWYEVPYRGMDLKLSKRSHLNPLLFGDTIRGYLKNVVIRPGDTVVDGGAFGGTLSIFLAKMFRCDIIAIEPDPSNVESLRTNLALNDVEDKVTVIEKALWRDRGQVRFDAKSSELSQVKEGPDNSEGTMASSVEATTLDRIHELHGGIDIVKLDIEGAEIPALEGAEQVMRDGAQFAIETQEESPDNVEEILRDHGYETLTGYPLHQTTWGWRD